MRRAQVALGVCFLAILFVFLLHSHVPAYSGIPRENDLKKHIQSVGATEAYKELVAYESNKPNSEQHGLGHLFGRLLYESEGISGFSVCDSGLFYGCYHEFIAHAILEKGVSVVSQLDAVCKKQQWPAGCEHGLGHGLVAYFGYSTSDLNKALHECDKVNELDPVKGCRGGAFMEMNLENMNHGSTLSYEKYGPSGICGSVARIHRPDCLFWLPQWWREAHFSTLTPVALYQNLGKLCMQVSTSGVERNACFRGTGYFAPPTVEFDKEKSKALCESVSSSPDDIATCWKEAASSAGFDT